MKTRQEIFTSAYVGLTKQGFARSVNEYGTCQYRDDNGRKCAIGHCIPDKKYRPNLEGVSIGSEFATEQANRVRRAAGVRLVDEQFASDLQRIHDEPHPPAPMQDRLKAFAAKHNLSIPEVVP